MPISPVLDRCILFHGLNDHDTASALAFFHAREHSYSRGESLRRPGDPVKSFGLVLEGQVHVLMDDFEGNRMLMSSVQRVSAMCVMSDPLMLVVISQNWSFTAILAQATTVTSIR